MKRTYIEILPSDICIAIKRTIDHDNSIIFDRDKTLLHLPLDIFGKEHQLQGFDKGCFYIVHNGNAYCVPTYFTNYVKEYHF